MSTKAHFGIYPFSWQEGWEESAKELIGSQKSYIQIAPVLERLVFPRAREAYLNWLDQIKTLKGLRWLIPAHYAAPIKFKSREIKLLIDSVSNRPWKNEKGNWKFLNSLDKSLVRTKVVPIDPLAPLA